MRARLAAVLLASLTLAGVAAAQSVPGGPRVPPRGGGGSGSSSGGGGIAVPLPEPGAIQRRWQRPDRELVVVAPTASAARPVLDALTGRDYTIARRARLAALGLELAVLQGPRRADLAADAAALAALHPEVSIGPNLRFARLGDRTGNGASPASPRALVGAGAPDPSCGRGLRLGMLDLLPNRNARALRGAALETQRIVPWGQRLADGDHGTAVAALLVGRGDDERLAGLAPGASLAAAGIFGRTRRGEPETSTEWIALGLDWVLARGAEVVNLSFGGPPDAVLERVAAAALASGAALVAAAGNEGPGAAPLYPAALDGVLAVTAVDVALAPWPQASQGAHVALAAPGVDVFTAGGKYRSGTSYAAPFATAALAFERARAVEGAAARVLAAARDLGPPGRDPVYGAGLVQLGGACPAPATAAR
jgi:subtilisin family serine protease